MPGGDFHPWFFVIVAAWILVCGLGVVLFKRIMYSAVSMVFCFLGVAFAYALLNAPLVAIIQILVYVGAISIVIIFAIMLTEVQTGRLELFFNRQTAVAAVVALLAAAVLAAVSLSADIGHVGERSLTPGLRQLSHLIFDRYVFPFELVSLVLIAAMIGAIVLATRERERT
jgi:NADH-quinone oxidoreductase subunit J